MTNQLSFARQVSFGRQVRLGRLFSHSDQRIFVVPLDHSVTDGPIGGDGAMDRLVGQIAANGVDAVVLHKGAIRHVSSERFAGVRLIVHLSASTARAQDPDNKYLVASVEESLRLGADAVSVHVNLGSLSEGRQIADFASVSEACDRWNVPLMAMVYPRGPRIDDPLDPELVAHAATLAADLGADVVKTPCPRSAAELRDIVRGCPIPLVVAGGQRKRDRASLDAFVEETVLAGAAGVAMGRNIFQAPDPGAAASRIASVIHREVSATRLRRQQLAAS
jgi:2-amino-4,5-dihydroxy-6-oxo-7-(phosphooxy)heptanoate synthase